MQGRILMAARVGAGVGSVVWRVGSLFDMWVGSSFLLVAACGHFRPASRLGRCLSPEHTLNECALQGDKIW